MATDPKLGPCMHTIFNVWRWLFRLCNLAITIMSVLALVAIFSEQSFTRLDSTPIHIRPNQTAGKDDSWPAVMRMSARDHFYTPPSPNFDSTQDEVIGVWQLPQRARLSETMLQIGRCQLTAAKRWPGFDTSQCFRLGTHSPLLGNVCVIAICLLFSMYRIFSAGPPVREMITGDDVANVGVLVLTSWIVASCWFGLWLYGLNERVFDTTYTLYGEMYPRSFYANSENWVSAEMMIRVNAFMIEAQMCILTIQWFYVGIKYGLSEEPKTPVEGGKGIVVVKKTDGGTKETEVANNKLKLEIMMPEK